MRAADEKCLQASKESDATTRTVRIALMQERIA
jgi:hypothetical protein